VPRRSPSSVDTKLRIRATFTVLASTGVMATAAGPADAASPRGAAGYVPQPQIARVACVEDCVGRQPTLGSTLKLSGRRLRAVRKVLFMGRTGRGDDVAVKVRPASSRSIRLHVPGRARSGPLSAMAGYGIRSRRTRPVKIMSPPPLPPPSGRLTDGTGPSVPGAPRVETAINVSQMLIGDRWGATFSYRISDEDLASVKVALVRLHDGRVVASWTPAVQPGQAGEVTWRGVADGTVAPDGRYAFRLVAEDATGATAWSAESADARRDAFDLHGHIFPVRGGHDFGSSGARFGAGRSHGAHQGQDVMSRCGTKLVAARGGVVKTKAYHGLAGHYLAIDGAETGVDYAYMHLREASPLDRGDRVYTGEEIGRVGATGNARGCHLHFEMWSAPGYYTGGHPFDPLPHLRAWDAYS
jgi:hypothetical protein